VDTLCSDIELSIFDEIHTDSFAALAIDPPAHLDTLYYMDQYADGACSWNDFKGHFDISNWWFHADNHDGNIYLEDLPDAVTLEGAKHSPTNNYKRYVASLKSIAPTAGYVAFDWNSFGGSFPHIDAFYFTINDTCVQLSKQHVTEGHFVSWYVQPGDTISLEQVSNGTANHISTTIFNFQFIPEEYKVIHRTWKFVDHYQDTTSCLQQITYLRPSLDDIDLPLNRDGYDAPFLSCGADISPDTLGFPYYENEHGRHYLSADTLHDFSVQYWDEVISSCGGNETIKRQWEISDHCSGVSVAKSQIIKIKDESEITISCPQNQAFNITKCAVSVYIRQPKAWSECNENIHVDIDWAYGSGSKVYRNVAPGKYEITFTARDGCGKEKVCSMWLDLIYDGVDVVSCKEDQYFSLPSSGQLTIAASDLVNINTTACSNSDYQFEIDGSTQLTLSCNDVGWTTHTIRYFDPSTPDLYQTCTVEINLSGSSGSITCPSDRTIDCGSDLSDLSLYGSPDVQGVPSSNIEYEEDRQISDCGVGYIDRKWTIKTLCNGYASCTQRITINESNGNIIITWPSDYEVNECNGSIDIDPDNLPDAYDYPEASNGGTCGDIQFSHYDVSPTGSEGCQTINRRWTATNSCDPSWSDTHTQMINIKDTDDPEIDAPSSQVVYNNDATCNGSYVTLALATVTDCDPTATVSNNSPYANESGPNASGNYPVGITEVTFTSVDRCGNQATEIITIEVISNGDPTLQCIGELDIQLSIDAYGNAGYTLTADQLVTSTSSSCDGDSYTYAFSESTTDISKVLTCSDKGLKGIDVFRYNGSEWVSCAAWVRITASDDVCPPAASFADVSGHITREDGEAVKYANIQLQGMTDVNSDNNGFYIIQDVPTGNNYTIAPKKEINVRNGISALDMVRLNRHLLGTRFLSSPYEIIACDVNNSESVSVGDLYLMNALVLGIQQDLDRAWKFVPSSYTFQNPTNPFGENFPQLININLANDITNQDFIAIKSGDVNNSADPKKLDGFEINDQPLILHAEDKKMTNQSSVELVLNPNDGNFIEGMQFTINFDPSMLRFEEVVMSFGLNANLVINDQAAEDGRIGIVFINYHQESILDLLRIRFHAHTQGQLSEHIVISSEVYQPEAIMNYEVRPIAIEFDRFPIKESFEFSVSPNPFRDQIRLAIEGEEDSNLDISVMDISGRIVSTHTTHITQGQNIYTLKKTDFENAGIYVIRLSDTRSSRWTRVVLID